MPVINQPVLTHLPLARRVRLVRAFAALIGALPRQPRRPRKLELPDHLRRDVGLPPASLRQGNMWPPPGAGKGLL